MLIAIQADDLDSHDKLKSKPFDRLELRRLAERESVCVKGEPRLKDFSGYGERKLTKEKRRLCKEDERDKQKLMEN